MKVRMRRALLMLISTSLLLVSITTAWILEEKQKKRRFIQVDYIGDNSLQVMSDKLTVQFLYQTASGAFEVWDKNDPVSLEGLVPNDMIPFRIRLTNKTGAPQTVSISLINITTNNPELFKMMYVGMSGGYGYVNNRNDDVVVPEEKYICFGDQKNGVRKLTQADEYVMTVYSSVVIPPTGNECVELDGYFWLNQNADISLAGCSLTIGHILVIL